MGRLAVARFLLPPLLYLLTSTQTLAVRTAVRSKPQGTLYFHVSSPGGISGEDVFRRNLETVLALTPILKHKPGFFEYAVSFHQPEKGQLSERIFPTQSPAPPMGVHQILTDVLAPMARKYKDETGKIPVVVLDNCNALPPATLIVLTKFAKDCADNFLSTHTALPRNSLLPQSTLSLWRATAKLPPL
jgi:hypothetical protein